MKMKFLQCIDLLKDLKKEYDKYKALMKIQDPPTQPYKSKYEALECLDRMKDKLTGEKDCEHKAAINSALLTLSGVIKTETEEFTSAEQLLSNSLELCESVADERFTLLSRLKALIYLGVIWCGREQYETARGFLEKSLKVHSFFKDENCQEIYNLDDLLLYSGEAYQASDQKSEAESLITHAYFYLAQVESKAGNGEKSASLCLTTLSRQLTSPQFDWRDWTRNCAGLSEFYLNIENFTAARYCIVAALTMLDRHKDEDKAKETEDESSNDNVRKTEAFVDRYCTKYGLALLEYSVCLQMDSDSEVKPPPNNEPISEVFQDLDVTSHLDQVTDNRIVNYEGAKKLFLWSQKHVQSAQRYFTIDERCSDYVDLTRDMSQLYKYLSHFELDDENKCKMHRRRADLLEPLHRDLSPTYYLLTIRQILFELGEIFSDMVDIKRARWQANPGNQHYAKKVNTLVKQSILYFETFLDTMRVEGKRPDKYNDESVRPALLAHFYIGRMHSKFVVQPNSHAELNNVNQTLEAYKAIVDYCDAHPEALSKVEEELSACREMVKLLPVKMEQIRRNMTV